MTIHKIIPDPNCTQCDSGIVYDIVDYGSTTARLPSLCECVELQVPESFDDEQDKIEVVEKENNYE